MEDVRALMVGMPERMKKVISKCESNTIKIFVSRCHIRVRIIPCYDDHLASVPKKIKNS